MPLISSMSNPTIKHIRALRQRKAREESGQFFIEGIRLVGEAVQLGAPVEALVVAPDRLESPFARQIVDEARGRGARVIEVTNAVFEQLSGKDNPHGLGALVRQRWTPLERIRPGGELCWIALHAPQDPGNLGTILRTGDAVGAAGVILLDEHVDPHDPGATRASMGAIFSLAVCRARTPDFLRWKAASGFALVGASDAAPLDYQAVTYAPPQLLLMGSERQGLPGDVLAACDHRVSLPMVGRGDSLNLAVATGVMLYEMFSQRRAAQKG
ncbi:MAG: RNA methyltransferase [Anaerolineae bacterium]|nr:RNA methyltransferase [Anaerolineae bacterium]